MVILALVTNFVLHKYLTRPNHQFVKTEVETKEISIKTSKGDFQTKVSEYENGRVKIYWELNDMSQDNPILSGILRKNSRTAGIGQISVLRFSTMWVEVSMVHYLWHMYFGSILSNGSARAHFVFWSE